MSLSRSSSRVERFGFAAKGGSSDIEAQNCVLQVRYHPQFGHYPTILSSIF